MPFYPDLTDYEYATNTLPRSSSGESSRYLNVGWLSREITFPTGATDPAAGHVLIRLATEPVNVFRGFHYCEFCDTESPIRIRVPELPGTVASLGTGEIHVPGENGVVYVAPTLIIHYMESHAYLPPQEFIDAALALGGRH
ncbi:hypothetical protein ACIBF1_04435 [Spirillospora sp. NPDC050679]